MSKFLKLVNENTPGLDDFMEQLKRSGVVVKKTDTGYDFTFSISLTDDEEEAEDFVGKQTSETAIDNKVSDLASSASLVGQAFGTVAGTAKSAQNKRKALYPQMITAYNKMTDKISAALTTLNTQQ